MPAMTRTLPKIPTKGERPRDPTDRPLFEGSQVPLVALSRIPDAH